MSLFADWLHYPPVSACSVWLLLLCVADIRQDIGEKPLTHKWAGTTQCHRRARQWLPPGWCPERHINKVAFCAVAIPFQPIRDNHDYTSRPLQS